MKSPEVFLFFGEMGSGKTYRGRLFAKHNKFDFWDGDEAVTPEMLERIQKFKPMTTEMVERFVAKLGDEILSRAQGSKPLVVAQALYRNDHRKQLIAKLQNAGIVVYMVQVYCPLIQNLKYLLSRERGLGWIWYWLINKPFYQSPDHKYATLMNDRDLDQIYDQL